MLAYFAFNPYWYILASSLHFTAYFNCQSHGGMAKTLPLSGVTLVGWLNQIQTNGLSRICFVVIKVPRQVPSPAPSSVLSSQFLEWDLESMKWENKDAAETLFWHVTLIPSKSWARRSGMCRRATGKYLLDIWQRGNKCNPSLLLSSSGHVRVYLR